MKTLRNLLPLLLLLLIACGPEAMKNSGDAIITARALLDSNNNGQADEQDVPLTGAFFILTDADGEQYIDITNENGETFLGFPGGGRFPMIATMEGPGKDKFVLIGAEIIALTEVNTNPLVFLFKTK